MNDVAERKLDSKRVKPVDMSVGEASKLSKLDN
jgi:hypothetical protein